MSAQAEPTTAAPECECIAEMDALLAPLNTRIRTGFLLSRGRMAMRPVIGVEKLEALGKRPATVVPTFCPFCGVPYQRDPAPASREE